MEHTGILVEREDLLVHSVLENLNDLGMRPVELVSGGLTHDGHEAARFHYANCLPEDAHGVSEVMQRREHRDEVKRRIGERKMQRIGASEDHVTVAALFENDIGHLHRLGVNIDVHCQAAEVARGRRRGTGDLQSAPGPRQVHRPFHNANTNPMIGVVVGGERPTDGVERLVGSFDGRPYRDREAFGR